MHTRSTSIRPCLAVLCLLVPLASGQELIRTVEGPRKIGLRSVSHYADINGDGIEEFLVGGDINGGYVAVIDGATNQPIYSYYGYDGPPGNGIGWAVAPAGDFDGDGVPDFMGGDYRYSDSNSWFRGRYLVWSGATGELLASGEGSYQDQYFGRRIAGVGDTNDSGYADVLVAGLDGPVFLFGGPDGHLIRTHVGPDPRQAVSGLGDVNGDGHADYIIGWPFDGFGTGRATVYSGLDGSELYSVYGEIAHGVGVSGDFLGLSVAGMGDIDGDGVPDFAVGLPAMYEPSFSATRPGKVRVYSGAGGALLYELDGLHWLGGGNRQFGTSIHSGRDVNGDGIQDLLVSIPRYPNLLGSVWVFSGANGTLLWKVPHYGSHKYNSGFIGDLTGDGLAEFATSIQTYDSLHGRVWIWAGGPGSVLRHCPSAPNSTGEPARLETLGPISVGYGELSLELDAAPSGQPALVFYGVAQAPAPFSNGTLCVSLAAGGVFRLIPATITDSQGKASFPIDWNTPPASHPQSALVPGSMWTFQSWFRDPPASPTGSNLSDALTITFVP